MVTVTNIASKKNTFSDGLKCQHLTKMRNESKAQCWLCD